jgi:tRNA pseudouridine65 synthase
MNRKNLSWSDPHKPQVVYEDADVMAVNKPPGLLTHPSPLDPSAATSLVTALRESRGEQLYPCHRLDRATSGVILFAKNKPALAAVNAAFAELRMVKLYLGLVRGWIRESVRVDYPLTLEEPRQRGGALPQQDAVTLVMPVQWYEHPTPSGRYSTTRLTLCEISPQTGRRHQIRRHFAHLRHPLVGDTTHGDGKLNVWARLLFHRPRLFLHASELTLSHPVSGRRVRICADPDSHWSDSINTLRPYACGMR